MAEKARMVKVNEGEEGASCSLCLVGPCIIKRGELIKGRLTRESWGMDHRLNVN